MSNYPHYLAIGHITQDLLPDGQYIPGGTVTFAALAAQKLGHSAAIVTAAPLAVRQDQLFQGSEIAGPVSATATIFENIYRPEGRQQFVRGAAPVLTAADVPAAWRQPAIVHLGPVAQECANDLFDLFPDAIVGLTPQGFMRQWDKTTGLVEAIAWSNASQILPKLDALILSIEDLPANPDREAVLASYAALCPVVACTFGAKGCRIYYNRQVQLVPAYPANEVDPTGAGDVFAAAFLLQLKNTANPIEAARFANAAGACHIEKAGPANMPDEGQIIARMKRA